MKWILILLIVRGAATAEFNSEEACRNALEVLKSKYIYSGVAGECFPKGEE